MVQNSEKQTGSGSGFDPRIQSENLAFGASEMVACSGCGRMNPPNRRSCIYCAGELAVTADNAAALVPNLRKLEQWERGVNVVLVERDADHAPDMPKLAARLSMETEHLAAILEHDRPLPLARVETETDAVVLQKHLNEFGLRCSLINDADLAPEKPPIRLSRIDLSEGHIQFKTFNTGEPIMVAESDLALIVPGTIFTSRVDTLEKKGRRGKAKLVGETTTAADEPVLDLYLYRDAIGFRVYLAGFDFSCLGEDKGLLATENLRRLTVLLKENAAGAKLVGDYSSVRHVIGAVWEVENRTDSQGLQRSGFGKRDFGSVETSSNLSQFTKYSRLQWQLL